MTDVFLSTLFNFKCFDIQLISKYNNYFVIMTVDKKTLIIKFKKIFIKSLNGKKC